MIASSTLLPLLLGLFLLAAAVALGVLAMLSMPRNVLRRRLRSLQRGYDGADGAEAEEVLDANSLGTLVFGMLERFAGRLASLTLVSEEQKRDLQQELLHAGIRRPDALRLLIAMKVLAMLALALVASVAAPMSGLLPQGALAVVGAGLAGALAGGLLPEYILKRRAKRRKQAILQRLPDALDLLIIFANAGYGLDAAIQRLSRDLARSAPDLADEFAVASNELRLMADRDQALENLARRTGLEPLRSLVSTLIQTQRYGTPLSQALRVLAVEQRNRSIMDLEERAAKLPVLITMPLILLILPALLIIVATPGFIQASHAWSGAKHENAGSAR